MHAAIGDPVDPDGIHAPASDGPELFDLATTTWLQWWPTQLLALLRKNLVVLMRRRAYLAALIAGAPVFVCLLWWLASSLLSVNTAPITPEFTKCAVFNLGASVDIAASETCISVAFAPDTDTNADLMRGVASRLDLQYGVDVVGYESPTAMAAAIGAAVGMIDLAVVLPSTYAYDDVVAAVGSDTDAQAPDADGAAALADAGVLMFDLWVNTTSMLAYARETDDEMMETFQSDGRSLALQKEVELGMAAAIAAADSGWSASEAAAAAGGAPQADISFQLFEAVPGSVVGRGSGSSGAATSAIEAVMNQLAGIFLTTGVALVALMQMHVLVGEKQAKLLGNLRAMGVTDSAHWLSWFIIFALPTLVSAVLAAAFGHASDLSLFTHTDFGVHVLALCLFALAFSSLCIMLASFVTRPVLVNIVTFLVFAVTFILQFFLTLASAFNALYAPQISSALKIIAFFIPGFHYGKFLSNVLAVQSLQATDAETAAAAAPRTERAPLPDPFFRWADLSVALNVTDAKDNLVPVPTAGDSLGYLVAQCVVYMVLAWYAGQVFAGDLGASQRFWFPFSPTYWGLWRKPSVVQAGDTVTRLREETRASGDVIIHKVSKSYGTTTALKEVSLRLRKGELLALLGRNGAGKTTLCSILGGLTAATHGHAFMWGCSVAEDIATLRHSFGRCDQEDLLWPDLSARQHLDLYCRLKGVKPRSIAAHVEERLALVKLTKVGDAPVRTFSGGMKRRLSVTCASVGNPRIIFLDEPSSGMDPLSKRAVWDMIHTLKRDRCVLLTSHSMTECDKLGDTIAILAEGRLRAMGTSLFLKSRFGLGYQLNLIASEAALKPQLKELVLNALPGADIVGDAASSLTLAVPRALTRRIPVLLRRLQEAYPQSSAAATAAAGAGGGGGKAASSAAAAVAGAAQEARLVREWSISMSSLEEVFLRLAAQAQLNAPAGGGTVESAAAGGAAGGDTGRGGSGTGAAGAAGAGGGGAEDGMGLDDDDALAPRAKLCALCKRNPVESVTLYSSAGVAVVLPDLLCSSCVGSAPFTPAATEAAAEVKADDSTRSAGSAKGADPWIPTGVAVGVPPVSLPPPSAPPAPASVPAAAGTRGAAGVGADAGAGGSAAAGAQGEAGRHTFTLFDQLKAVVLLRLQLQAKHKKSNCCVVLILLIVVLISILLAMGGSEADNDGFEVTFTRCAPGYVTYNRGSGSGPPCGPAALGSYIEDAMQGQQGFPTVSTPDLCLLLGQSGLFQSDMFSGSPPSAASSSSVVGTFESARRLDGGGGSRGEGGLAFGPRDLDDIEALGIGLDAAGAATSGVQRGVGGCIRVEHRHTGRADADANIGSDDCAPGCYEGWPGDGYCDTACRNFQCNYDLGDCDGVEETCSGACPAGYPGDGYCDQGCMTPQCNWDDGDCGNSTDASALLELVTAVIAADPVDCAAANGNLWSLRATSPLWIASQSPAEVGMDLPASLRAMALRVYYADAPGATPGGSSSGGGGGGSGAAATTSLADFDFGERQFVVFERRNPADGGHESLDEVVEEGLLQLSSGGSGNASAYCYNAEWNGAVSPYMASSRLDALKIMRAHTPDVGLDFSQGEARPGALRTSVVVGVYSRAMDYDTSQVLVQPEEDMLSVAQMMTDDDFTFDGRQYCDTMQPTPQSELNGIVSALSTATLNTLLRQRAGDDAAAAPRRRVVGARFKAMPSLDFSDPNSSDGSSGPDPIAAMHALLLPLLTMMMLPQLVNVLVTEKEDRLFSLMKIEGMQLVAFWLGNWIYNFLLLTWVAGTYIVTGYLLGQGDIAAVEPQLYVALMLAWGHAQAGLAFTIAGLFRRARTATILSYLLLVLSVITAAILNAALSVWPQGALWIAPLGFSRACYLLLLQGQQGVATIRPSSDLAEAMTILFWFGCIGCVIGIYLYEVLPGAAGSYEPAQPFFCLGKQGNRLHAMLRARRLQAAAGGGRGGEAAADIVRSVHRRVYDAVKRNRLGVALSGGGGGGGGGRYNAVDSEMELAPMRSVIPTRDGSDIERAGDGGVGVGVGDGGGGDGGGGMAHARSNEDIDVAAERERVMRGDISRAAVVAAAVNKSFHTRGLAAPVTAVRNVYLAVNYGEAFGLLGANGAGKTTLISMLSTTLMPDGGVAMVAGYDTATQTRDVMNVLGVAPQFTTCWPDLTTAETLRFFARMRGVPSTQLRGAVQSTAERVMLDGDAFNMKASALSGGMRRRLALGIAFIGDPKVVYLDEPSTGLDVESRRAIWQIIEAEKRSGRRAFIISSHDMAEADTLSTRIGIMAFGRLRVVGTQARLKARFGEGFKLQLSLVSGAEDVRAAAHRFVTTEVCPGAEVSAAAENLTTVHEGMRAGATASGATAGGARGAGGGRPRAAVVEYSLPADVDVAAVFGTMERRALASGVEYWGIVSPSLEDVFVTVARASEEEQAHEDALDARR